MKTIKWLPCLAAALCIPGIVLRAMHLLNGFEADTGLPKPGNIWFIACIVLFLAGAAAFALLAAPLRGERETPFEQLLGTQSPLFRMAAVMAGLLLVVGGAGYLYLTMTTVETDAAGWARALEIVYAAVTICAGAVMVLLAAAQGREMTAASAKLTIVPLLWSCIHLLVNYRMTCTDPKMPSFAFGLIGDVLLVLTFYHLARLLFGKPQPMGLAFCGGAAALLCLSDIGGYGLAFLMGARIVEWPAKMVLRGGLAAAACVLVLAELFVLCRARRAGGAHLANTAEATD